MQNVLADLCLDAEAATATAMRLARAFDEGDHAFRRLATAVAKYWVCKATPPVVAEALECLGGNGYVEESSLPRLYTEPELAAIVDRSAAILGVGIDAGRHQGHRPARSRHAAHRQPAAQARPRPRPGPRRRPRRRSDRHGGDARDGDRRRGPRFDRPQAAGRDRPEVRLGAGRRRRAGRRPVRGDRDHRGRLRAVPAPARVHRPDAAGPDRHRPRAGAPVRARLRDPAAAPLGPGHGRPVGPAGGRRPAVDRGPADPRPRTRDGRHTSGTRVALRGRDAATGRTARRGHGPGA